MQPGGPGNDHAGVAPTRGKARIRRHGSGRADAVEGRADLRSAHIPGELAREGRQIHVVRGGAPEDFGVAHPAEALVALRAVGGNADKVGALPPLNVLPQLVDHRAAGRELCREGRIGVEDHGRHSFLWRRCTQPGDFKIAEAVEGEVRHQLFDSIAGQNKVIGYLGRAQIVCIDGSIVIDNFGESHLDFGSCRSRNP